MGLSCWLPSWFVQRQVKPPWRVWWYYLALMFHLGLQAAVCSFRAKERAGGEDSGCKMEHEVI